ncbi:MULTISPECIES: ABC transporter permease [Clostridium]|uniref:ABC transporter permease n=1 Tax=Clostridium aquiflavi TaxID=3073603 RepID=A0ABU1EES8_9CLOT|nr:MULTISPECIES: ABC transporter permease [unclassified Clostridium]MDR5586637.1 ABC transporter permease [Clostridium sp. 5N-1]NFG60555.1 ABC transporter permease [Clostridium botulinum]NFQ09802.1 ABC transporter permease [Clostridium botulinum]
MKIWKHIKGYLIFIILLAAWQIVCDIGIWSSYILPTPQKVFNTFINMIQNGSIFIHIYTSMRRVFIGFGISAVIGIPLGIAFGMNNNIYEYWKVILNFLRNVPPLAMIPMLILWFGIGESTKIIIIVLAAFFPIFTSTLKGIRNCDPKLIEVGKAFEINRLQIITRIIIPNALLDIVVGLKLSLGYSFRAIIGAELIAASSGLGYLISDGKEMSRTDIVIVGIIVIGVLGVICDFLFAKLVKKVSKGKTVEAYE